MCFKSKIITRFFVVLIFLSCLLLAPSGAGSNISTCLADGIASTSYFDISIPLNNKSVSTLTENTALWSDGEYEVSLYDEEEVFLTPSYACFTYYSKLTISMPNSCNSVFLETNSMDGLDNIILSEGCSLEKSTSSINGATITRSNTNNIVITTDLLTAFIKFKTITFNIGSIECFNPVGGWINDNGKKSLVAFGFKYSGVTLVNDSDYGIVVYTDDVNDQQVYSNGTLASLSANDGRFYCYFIDNSEITYHAKAFVKINETTYYSNLLESTGSLSGTEYKI